MASTEPWVLGISSAFHNGSACLLHGEEIIVAVQEERLTRVKRDRLRISGPSLAIEYCLSAAGITPQHLDMIVDSTISIRQQDPHEMLRQSAIARAAGSNTELASIPHHLAHAYSAHATSGFGESLTLVIDGGGSFSWQLPPEELRAALRPEEGMCEHASVYHFTRDQVTCLEKHMAHIPYILYENHKGMFPFATIGHMYASVSKQLFGDYLEAGKVMGLAPYGTPTTPVDDFLGFDGERFNFYNHVPDRFLHDDRWPCRKTEYENLAASTQRALEYALSALVSKLPETRLSKHLCYAGGVALNSVANDKIVRNSSFEQVHIVPAAEDSGPAIGAAYYGLAQLSGAIRGNHARTDFFGRRYDDDELTQAIRATPRIDDVETGDPIETTAGLLEDGKIVGWFEGGSEFGPRALGHRSILCDPRRKDAKLRLNRRVKHRESFRPFAPIVLSEHLQDWFETKTCYRAMAFMLQVCPFKPAVTGKVPGVVHVDGTGRLQTVVKEDNPALHAVLRAFHKRTGIPMLINTSFNIMGEPLVETPTDTLLCFLTTGIDYLYLDGHLICKHSTVSSVLDLTPVVNSHVRLDAAGPGTVGVTTAHGPWVYRSLPSSLFLLLRQIDGKSTGWHLYRNKNLGLQDETSAISQLTLLARYSMIRFLA